MTQSNTYNIKQYRSNGKLLITGEYLVLKGAKALALPVKLGQKLEIGSSTGCTIDWVTFEKDQPIFTASYNPNNLEIIETIDENKATYIQGLLLAAQKLNPEFLYLEKGLAIKASIEFNMQWGLGTSSTLINNIAQWANIDAFELNRQISKGSGYDIACAQNNNPIIYQKLIDGQQTENIDFNPPFLKQINLVYLNQKMATEKNIAKFLKKEDNFESINQKINQLTTDFLNCSALENFMQLIAEHEQIIAEQIDEIPVKQKLFSNFEGSIKSLGAWGGDFALVASTLNYTDQEKYFANNGYLTFFPLTDLL